MARLNKENKKHFLLIELNRVSPQINEDEYYNHDYVLEQTTEGIRKNCFSQSEYFWGIVKEKMSNGERSTTPFVYFDNNKRKFVLSKNNSSEELSFVVTKNGLKYQDHDVVISPLFYQKAICEKESDLYVQYQSASLIEGYVTKRLRLQNNKIEGVLISYENAKFKEKSYDWWLSIVNKFSFFNRCISSRVGWGNKKQ